MGIARRVDFPEYAVFTAEKLRAHLRLDTDIEDVVIDDYIATANDYVQQRTSWILPKTQFVEQYRRIAGSTIELHWWPIIDFDIIWKDADGNSHDITDDWILDAYSDPACLVMKTEANIPLTPGRPGDVTISYHAGHETVHEIPETLRAAVRIAATLLFSDRAGSENLRTIMEEYVTAYKRRYV